MRIVVDLQCAQVDIRRGEKGSDALELVKQFAKSEDIDLVVALNGLFSTEVDILRKALSGSISAENVQVWVPPELPGGSIWHLKVSELIREASIFSLGPDYVVVPGHLINGREGVIFTAGLFPGQPPTITTNPAIIDASLTNQPQVFGIDALLPSDTSLSKRAEAIISFCQENFSKKSPLQDLASLHKRPKLAFISPLLPEKSGISFYSSELIPELSRYYDVDVIVAQESIADSWITENCGVLTPDMLVENMHLYERVIYHFGNSPFHSHMFDLIEQIPGVVVLHDFYLGDLANFMESGVGRIHWFTRTLYASHGYKAVTDYFIKEDIHSTIKDYPISHGVFEKSLGVVVHTAYAKKLAEMWYPKAGAIRCCEVPLLRQPAHLLEKGESRKRLGIDSDDFIVCSFGLLGRYKLNHCLIEAWKSSRMAQQPRCKLVFVGEASAGSYGVSARDSIKRSKDIQITGWVEDNIYRDYLAAADMAVQLRSESRGETSAAVLDCMNYGLATIVNATGSMIELSEKDVFILNYNSDDDRLVNDLKAALEDLWQDHSRRKALGRNAASTIRTKYSPAECTKQYVEAIEQGRLLSLCNKKALMKNIAGLGPPPLNNDELIDLAERIAQSLPSPTAKKQLFVDVSVTSANDLRTGIQRVLRSITIALIDKNLSGYRIEPVYLSQEGGRRHYRYARKWVSKIFGHHSEWAEDEPIEHAAGDLLLIADFISVMLPEAMRSGIYDGLRRDGVKVIALVYDILPLTLPSKFPAEAASNHRNWLESVLKLDGAVCISRSVMNELSAWISTSTNIDLNHFPIDWFHLGADIKNSAPTTGFPKNYKSVLEKINRKISFLMVGTIEPRKGHAQILAAFEDLWANEVDVSLVIVGKNGWMVEELVKKLSRHSELGRRLFWLKGISDEYLEEVYAASTCLIAASEGEGFGLPLIEAAQYGLPIIVRDIPVFREVAGEYAFYFINRPSPEALAEAINDWLSLYKLGRHPKSDLMPWQTWQESTERLLSILSIKEKSS